jgi:predicted Rossmann-fold nucleotide-binding protein
VDGFYEPLLRYFDHMVTEGFVRPESRRLAICRDTGDALLAAMEEHEQPPR